MLRMSTPSQGPKFSSLSLSSVVRVIFRSPMIVSAVRFARISGEQNAISNGTSFNRSAASRACSSPWALSAIRLPLQPPRLVPVRLPVPYQIDLHMSVSSFFCRNLLFLSGFIATPLSTVVCFKILRFPPFCQPAPGRIRKNSGFRSRFPQSFS